MTETVVMKPNTATLCCAKIKKYPNFKNGFVYSVIPTDRGYLASEPGLEVKDSIAKLLSRKLKVMIFNHTGKTFKIKRNTIVVRVEPVEDANVVSEGRFLDDTELDNDLRTSDIDVPDQRRKEIEELVNRNGHLFAKTDFELGGTNTVQMYIDTGDSPPIKVKPYRLPLQQRPVVEKCVNEMLEAGNIQRSGSPYSFPVVLIKKRDGSTRFYIDFRALNKVTKDITYPLLLIDDILSTLHKKKYFTSVDLKSGYWQIAVKPEYRHKTSLGCLKGFEFLKMPFGAKCSGAYFSELMDRVVLGLGHIGSWYLDDVIIYSETIEEHLRHIQLVFGRFKEHNLKMKLGKYTFAKSETKYLGFLVNDRGIRTYPDKVKAIRTLSATGTTKEARSFLGMCVF